MRPTPARLVAIIGELRRRKVLRTAFVYGVAGVGLIEATAEIAGVFALPDIIPRAVALLTLLGMPVVLLVSWAYDITADGLRPTLPLAPGDPAESTTSPAPQIMVGNTVARSTGSVRLSGAAKIAVSAAVLGVAALIYASFDRVGPADFDPLSWTAGEFVDSIAVVTLENLTSDPAYQALAVGITEEINRELTQFRQIKVIGRHSVEAFAEAGLTTRQLADSVGVRYVIDGSLQLQGGNQVRAVVSHTDAKTQALVWSKAFSASLDDPIAAQETIAADVTRELLAHIPGMPTQERATPIEPGAGQQTHQLGVHWLARRTPEGLRRAIDLLNQSIEQDPTFAPAWADLSSAYALTLTYRYSVGLDGYVLAGRALVAAERAVELAPSLADGYSARGYIKAIANAPVDDVVADFRKAATIRPSAPSVPSWSSRVLAAKGRDDEAFAAARRAVELDPMSAGRHIAVAYLSLHLGRYAEAIEAARTANTLEPEITLSRAIEGRALLLLDRADECASLMLGPHAVLHGTCLLASGDQVAATAIIDSITQTFAAGGSEDDFTDVLRFEDLAVYHAWLGDAPGALRWIERAYAESPVGIEVRVLQSALFDRVRSAPGFERNVSKIRAGLWEAVERAAADGN